MPQQQQGENDTNCIRRFQSILRDATTASRGRTPRRGTQQTGNTTTSWTMCWYRSGILDVGRQTEANISSDQAPITIKTRFKLKAIPREGARPAKIFHPLTQDKSEAVNSDLRKEFQKLGGPPTYPQMCTIIATVATKHFLTIRNDKTHCKWSDTTTALLLDRGQAKLTEDCDEARRLD